MSRRFDRHGHSGTRSQAINAALISAAQKVEHYEMVSYGCLHEWAGLLGNEDAARLLQEILGEEKAANETLTDLARNLNCEVRPNSANPSIVNTSFPTVTSR